MQKSIVELLDAYRKQQVSASEAEQELLAHKNLALNKLKAVATAQVPEADREQWEHFVGPGLEVAFQGLVGAAAEGLVYVQSRNADAYTVAIALAAQAVEITDAVQMRLGLMSEPTQAFITRALDPHADVVSMKQALEGTAESSLSFLD